MVETVQIVVGGSPMSMFVATPAGGGKGPGVLVSHHQNGLSEMTRIMVEKFASEGFTAVAPDHYHRTPELPDIAAKKKVVTDENLIVDMKAAVDWLRAHPRVDPNQTIITGYCMGGRHTLLGAATIPGFRAAGDFYGGGVMNARGGGPTVFERLSGITCPVGGWFGLDDHNPPPDEARKVEAELKRLGVPVEDFVFYKDTGHGFMDPTMGPPKYNAASAEDAWTRSMAFFRRCLGEAQRSAAE